MCCKVSDRKRLTDPRFWHLRCLPATWGNHERIDLKVQEMPDGNKI